MISLVFITFVIILWIYLRLKPFLKAQKGLKVANQLDFYKKYLTKNHEDFYEEVIGPLIREKNEIYWTGYDFHAILHNPEDVKTVLISEKCFEKPAAYGYAFKYAMLTIGGEKYKQQRKSLVPLFSIQNLRSLIPIIDENTNKFLKKYSDELKDKSSDLKIVISKFTFLNICDTILGVENLDPNSTDKFIIDAENFIKVGNDRIYKPWLYPNWTYKMSNLYKLKQKCLDWIDLIAAKYKSSNNKMTSYFDCMANLTSKMEKEEFLDSLSFFLGASYETTAQIITNTLLLLSLHQNEQNKLFQEISTTLSSSEDEVIEDKLISMVYLECVIKETLRLLPISLAQMRSADDDIKLSNFVAPKGTILLIPTCEIQRDKEIWGEDALEFRPERFADENYKNIHPYAYIPFSSGPRMCPGYKYAMIVMKIFLSRFIMKYKVSSSSVIEVKNLKMQLGLSTKVQNSPEIEIYDRF